MRQRLLDLVRRQPGSRPAELSRQLAANRGTTQYYLTLLERSGHVEALRIHRTTRYFAADQNPAERPLLAIILQGRALEVVREVCRHPGVSQHALTQGLPISRRLFRKYANHLIRAGLLHEVRDAHTKRLFPQPRLHELLRKVDLVEADQKSEGPEPDLGGGSG